MEEWIVEIRVNGKWQGTGTAIGRDLILTAFHVIAELDTSPPDDLVIEVRLYRDWRRLYNDDAGLAAAGINEKSQLWHRAKLAWSQSTRRRLDVALLRVEPASWSSLASSAESPKVIVDCLRTDNTTVSGWGFPRGEIRSDNTQRWRISGGIAGREADAGDQTHVLNVTEGAVEDKEEWPGYSGTALFSDEGKLVGLVTRMKEKRYVNNVLYAQSLQTIERSDSFWDVLGQAYPSETTQTRATYGEPAKPADSIFAIDRSLQMESMSDLLDKIGKNPGKPVILVYEAHYLDADDLMRRRFLGELQKHYSGSADRFDHTTCPILAWSSDLTNPDSVYRTRLHEWLDKLTLARGENIEASEQKLREGLKQKGSSHALGIVHLMEEYTEGCEKFLDRACRLLATIEPMNPPLFVLACLLTGSEWQDGTIPMLHKQFFPPDKRERARRHAAELQAKYPELVWHILPPERELQNITAPHILEWQNTFDPNRRAAEIMRMVRELKSVPLESIRDKLAPV